jgi:hypothetical protein
MGGAPLWFAVWQEGDAQLGLVSKSTAVTFQYEWWFNDQNCGQQGALHDIEGGATNH